MANTEGRPRDSKLMAILAAVAFILWGLWVNWDHGLWARVQVALTQGLISLIATYYSAELVVWAVGRYRTKPWPVLCAGTLSYLIIYTLVWLGHLVAGTPELLATMLPGMITGLFFCYGYALRVVRYQDSE